jgi:hypothetical protein
MPVVVIKVAVSFGKTPAVTTIVVSKIAVAAPGLSYVTLRKITATHVRSIPHAMWFISTHCVGSGPAYRMRTSAPSASASASTSTFVGYQGQITLVTWNGWKGRRLR